MPGAEALEDARSVWRAVENHLYDPRTGLYGERTGRLRRRWRYVHLWPFSAAWSASCALAFLGGVSRSRLERHVEALERYRPAGAADAGLSAAVVAPYGPGGERYFDDNAWIGLALCRQERLVGEPALGRQARRLADYLASGWLDGGHLARPGGIRWKEGLGPGSRNTCSNAPAAELAATLYLQDGDAACLELARRVYAWTHAALGTVRGLYADRIAPDGTVNASVLSYNQGTMIGAGVLLHEATGEARYLDDAARTARSSVGRYGDGTALAREHPGFVAIYLRNLLFLDRFRPDPSYRALARSYARHLTEARRGDGLVRPLSRQASALFASAALVEVLSMLAGAPASP